MRISDWSSDVCSSDLQWLRGRAELRPARREVRVRLRPPDRGSQAHPRSGRGDAAGLSEREGRSGRPHRSEEHTSELQSLMRISYAVFCLKKKNYNYENQYEENANHLIDKTSRKCRFPCRHLQDIYHHR